MNSKLVKTTKYGSIKKMVALLLVVVLTMFDFIPVGTEIVSYAADAIETATNNKNVTFDIYFKDESGANISEKEEKINNENIKLFAQVSVKNDGYFNGTISLENCNFNLKSEVLSSSINKIEGNKVTLNQINSGETAEIEIGISPIKEETISSGLLNMSSTISIDGIYRNSKEKDINISSKREVKLKLADPYAENEGTEITNTVLTNKVYEVEGTSKRIVQVLVESGLKENGYPVKENNIEISVPNGVENVEVNTRGMLSTNGKNETEFSKNSWNYSEKEQKVNVCIKNDIENKTIKWTKNGKDRIVVTYIMKPETNIASTDITAKSIIKLYDEKETTKVATATAKVLEEKDGIVTTNIELEEPSIYKGKIYSGENRDYRLKENIYVSSNKTANSANIELNASTYAATNGETQSNIQYTSTKINKADVVRILGAEGTLKILNTDGTTIAEINNQSETDENGNIIVNYAEGTNALKVVTTEAKQPGTISLVNTKTIKQDGSSRETKRTYNAIVEKMTGTEARIELKETETKADLNVNKNTLSTLAKNENVEMTVTLLTNNEKYDLYKNPTFEITLPESIKDINVKTVQPIYSEMFRVKDTKVVEGNNKSRILRIALEGEQANYTTEVNQTTILITADIEFETLAPSNSTAIRMNYSNENATQPTYSTEKAIEVESKYGLMMYTTMDGFNEENEKLTTMDDEIVKGSLDVESGAKNATVKETIINNYDETMQNVSIIGRIPTEGINDGTVNTKLTSKVRTSLPNAQVLYSNNENAKAEDDTWNTNSENAKSFKIDVDNLEKGAKVDAEYSFEIPENLDYGQKLFASVDTDYTYLGNTMTQKSILGAETAKLTGVSMAKLKNSVETNLENGLKVNIGTTTAGRELNDGESVYEGQAIEYTVYITNNTGRDLTNANISVEQENGTMYGLKEVEVYPGPIPHSDEEYKIEHVYKELDTNVRTFNNIESIKNGDTIAFKYEIVTNEIDNTAKTQGRIKFKADEFDETTINTISNNIEQAELKLNYRSVTNDELKLYYGQANSTFLTMKNITGKALDNVNVKIYLPEGSYVEDDFYFASIEDDEYEKEDERIRNVKYNENNNTVTFDVSEIKQNESVNFRLSNFIKDINGESKDLVYMAEANINNDKTYCSNVLTKTMYNIERNVTLDQKADIDDNEVLQDGQEFTLEITAKNESDKAMHVSILDKLPDSFSIKNAYIENDNSENNNVAFNGIISANKNIDAHSQLKIIANIKVSAYNAPDSVLNKVDMVYGEIAGDGATIYSYNIKDEKNYKMNVAKETDNVEFVEISQTANIENKSTINNGEEIVYTAKIKNISNDLVDIVVKDTLPSGMEVKEILLNGENMAENYNNDSFKSDSYLLDKQQEVELKITAVYNADNTVDEELTNIVSVQTPINTIRSNAITYYSSSSTENNNSDSNNGDGSRENTPRGNDSSNVKYDISGLAWLDTNKNGQRDQDEKLMEGIEVKLLDTETGNFVQENGNDLSVTTQANGTYTFNVQRGNYIVVFMYDSNKYAVTQYQKAGVSMTENSDVINKVLNINNNSFEVAATDTIKLVSDDIKNIDMGLLENTKFDFEFKKYISEITVRTSKGTNTYPYDDKELAKVEIHAKELNNANVIIKYTMRVTNNGEIAGYVKDIVDYMPNTLTFNSELNTDWYQANNNLHNTSLLNTKINAGETKDITLILTKNMTENNTGLISNLAELADVNNELGVEDLDSTPGNKAQGEDDLGKADVIISVKTGALVTYVSLVFVILIVIGAGAVFINKKVLKNNIEEDINL